MATQAPLFGLSGAGPAAVASHADATRAADGTVGAGTAPTSPPTRLDRQPPRTALEAAGVATALALSLADLHELGQAHGGLDPGSIRVDARGAPLLPERRRRRESVDAAAGPAPADDIAALGAVISWMLDRAGAHPARRRRRARRHRHPTPVAGPAPRRRRLRVGPAGPADVLADIAARCCDPDPGRRPTARAVAVAIRTGVPAARFPQGAEEDALVVWPKRDDGAGGHTSGRRGTWAVAIALALAPLGIGLGLIAATDDGRRPAPMGGVGDGGRSPAPAPVVEPVHAVEGVLAVDGRRYAVGDADDVAVGAAFGCGTPQAVLLRRPTGDVYAFDRLPHEAENLPGRFVAEVPDGVALEVDAADNADGCPGLAVRRADGSTVALPTRPRPDQAAGS